MVRVTLAELRAASSNPVRGLSLREAAPVRVVLGGQIELDLADRGHRALWDLVLGRCGWRQGDASG